MCSNISRFLAALVFGICFVHASSDSLGHEDLVYTKRSRQLKSSKPLQKIDNKARSVTEFKNSTSINQSWDSATLFTYTDEEHASNTTISAGVNIVCTTCYIKGIASAELTVAEDFNITQAINEVSSEIASGFDNITSEAISYVEDYFDTVVTNVEDDGLSFDDFDLPPLDVDFDISIPDIPESQLHFQFDGLELYMQIDTTLSAGATYNLNLYSSKTAVGFTLGKEMLLGLVFTVDLILSVNADMDITSGFHIKVSDGLAFDLPLFNQNVSSITFNGAEFEFLPVGAQSAGVLTALLRVGMTTGVELATPTESVDGIPIDFSSGIEAQVYADLAQFTTNITATTASDDEDCALRLIEDYSMLLGANAGATLAVLGQTWGPAPSTQIPIYYTTMENSCALKRSSSSTTSTVYPTQAKRKDLTTTTLTTKSTFTATSCLSTGMINCPASLQTVSKTTVTQSLITEVPSGSSATFPAAIHSSVSTIAFGTQVHQISSTSGTPISYTPTISSSSTSSTSAASSSDTGGDAIISGHTGGVSNKLIIGLSVGLGVPFLIAVAAGSFWLYKRSKASGEEKNDEPGYFDRQNTKVEPQTLGSILPAKKNLEVTVMDSPSLSP